MLQEEFDTGVSDWRITCAVLVFLVAYLSISVAIVIRQCTTFRELIDSTECADLEASDDEVEAKKNGVQVLVSYSPTNGSQEGCGAFV